VRPPARPSDLARAAFVLTGAIAQIALGSLPFILGWSMTIADRSAEAETLLTPAGYAFSIWSVLFLGCAIYAVVHAVALTSPAMRRSGWFAGAACWLNAAWESWVPAFGIEAVSLIIILGCWAACLAFILTETRAGEISLPGRAVRLPLYALGGWLNAAAAVNFLSVMQVYDVPVLGSGEDTAALAVLVGALVLAAGVILRTGSASYALTVGWALMGIISRLTSGGADTAVIEASNLALYYALPALVLLGWAGRAFVGMGSRFRPR
jgi:hypothetical protein